MAEKRIRVKGTGCDLADLVEFTAAEGTFGDGDVGLWHAQIVAIELER